MTKPYKIRENHDRYRFWSDKKISQLSFHNNLLLTLGVAAIGYLWKERDSVYKTLIIDFHSSIDWKVFLFFVGIAILFLSLLSGFLLSLSRLYDLRMTANIVLTRRLAEKEMNVEVARSIRKGARRRAEKGATYALNNSVRYDAVNPIFPSAPLEAEEVTTSYSCFSLPFSRLDLSR